MTGSSPTVRQRELGKRLRELRNERGMTVEDVADKLLCSATKISRLETGARRPSLRDVRDLCALYEVGESTSADFMSLARGAREQGWWTQYDDLSLDPLIGLEQEATAITCYSMYYMPALMQTEDYARVIIKAIAPKMDSEILQQRVQARLRRQQLLAADNRPRYRVLLDEAVLHRTVGGPKVMAAQLGTVLEAVRQDKMTVQVIPFNAGAHAAADGYFMLLEFDDSNLTPVVFLEGLTGIHFRERTDEIARYREAIEYLRNAALSPRDSTSLMAKAAAGLHRQPILFLLHLPEGNRKGFFMSENTSAPADISWRVSRTCDSGACVGVARRGDVIMIGNTNNPAVPANEFSVDEWCQFLAGVKLGDFDELA